MNVTIDVVERLDSVVEEVEQERETDTRDERQNKRDHHVSHARWSNRRARHAAVRFNIDFAALVALRDLHLAILLLQRIQILLVGFERLRVSGHFDLIARLLVRDAALLHIHFLNALLVLQRGFVLGFQTADRFRRLRFSAPL